MTTIAMNEYVYESVSGNLEVSFKCFPHLTSDTEIRNSITKFFRKNMNDRIDQDFGKDPFLALTYTLAVELWKVSVLVKGEGNGATILDSMQNHIKKDLKLKGIILNYVHFKDKKLLLKHTGVLY